jgi:flagellar basal-body rod protein FlgC
MGDGGISIPTGGPGGGIRQPMRGLGIAASGLSAQRARMEAISENIANAETTRGPDGTPYRRKIVSLEQVGFQPLLNQGAAPTPGDEGYGGVRVTGLQEDASEGPLVYDPGHPDADENGYVRMPNVDINTEMVDLMDTRRVFEANATVFQAIKSMLHKSAQL